MKQIKLRIGVPILFPYIHYRFWRAFEQMEKPKDYRLDIVTGTTISVARNRIARFSMGSDYLLFLDCDMEPPSNLIEQLLSHDKDIIGALAFQRKYPYEPTLFRTINGIDYYRPSPNDDIMEVDATGMSCCLIKTKVFDKLKEPWFDFSPYHGGVPNIEFYGEDISFCRNARSAGLKIFVDTSIEVGHITEKVVGSGDYRPKPRMFEELDKKWEERNKSQ